MLSTSARAKWQSGARTIRPGDAAHGEMGEKWLDAVKRHFSPGGGHLDLGCGEGRMTFALAERWAQGGWSIGLDRDEAALHAARARAENLPGAQFLLCDVEKEDYGPLLQGRIPDLITAHLCMGPEIVERAARALPPGGIFAFVALHPSLWSEAGATSRFSLDQDQVDALLAKFHLAPLFLRLEKDTLEFSSGEAALSTYFREDTRTPAGKETGRREAIRKYFLGGGKNLTVRAQAQCVARKAAP
ncbi:MAG: methyltransferase domain-containing protein [bacterium]|nr:methyltransferase domain-containing protein [bacterium]